MAKYHFNIYPISADDFTASLDLLKDYAFHLECDSKFPYQYGDAFSSSELKLMLKSLPENITYIVRKSFDRFNVMYSVWILPTLWASSAIDYLINSGFIVVDLCARDVGFYELKDVLNDLPYNYHYVVQRYYD